MECEVCLEYYNEGKRLPRSLSCGHTFCTQCLTQIIKRGPLRCPYCRAHHRGIVLCPADLPLHEELTRQLAETRADTQTGDSTETQQLNVLKLREDVRKASTNGQPLWTLLATQGGQTRHSHVSLLNNRLHLHVLVDGQPPSGPQTVPYNQIQDLQDEDFSTVFFDVTLQGSYRGRVYMVLLDNEGRTRQFKALCTGSLGPSYLRTRFLEVSRKGTSGEQVWGGDYEQNDGTGGSALPGMDRGARNNQDVVAGLVAGFYFHGYGQDRNPSHFGIYTRDMPGYVEMSAMGRVIEGMDVLTSIVSLEDTRSAFISDCGLLLSH
ncbi:uncharacterized protein LOC126987602 [Eriocheir sinensis]|uniref:uncharacterized protein LOC126987602 n=1 Tax=Eriocheir sinensis TaxID=95602 RepID=UPI0021C97B2C|nr:uncharacterized protein LOC126987602 [Eriocheir sinensis]XP_050700675.1 uncharacterized protein LOC126987602 [Eriocheir sinensis]XP_050700676.1 uncharacterized protein LOC126987602 [Eriocheir sinensis]